MMMHVAAPSASGAILSAFRLEISQSKTTLKLRQQFEPSDAAMEALAFIGNSTKLSPAQKRSLTRLVAMVDEFAGGSPKLMRSIMGIASLMAMHSEKTYAPTPMKQMLEWYQEEREKLARSKGEVQISVETSILALEIEVQQGTKPPEESAKPAA